MLDFGNEMIRIGPRSKSRIMNKKYATAWIYSSKRSKLVTIKMAGRLLNSIVQGLHHSMFHLLHGAKRLCSRFLKRYDLCRQEIGRWITHSNGKSKATPSDGMRLGRLLGLGSKIHVCINLNVCSTRMAGLLVNWISSFDGMEKYDLWTSNQGTQEERLQKVSNINCGFMLGSGREQARKARLLTWRDGTSQARNESSTMPQVKKNLHQWIRSFSTSTNR